MRRAAPLAWLLALVAACAPLEHRLQQGAQGPLVFPAPPDQARFVYERSIYTSADVVPDDRQASMRRMLTGEARTGTPLTKPYAVAVHRGRIFLSDTVERYVVVFDVPQGRYFRIGENDPGKLVKPIGLDVDHSGTLYVADATQKTVMVFDRDGNYLRRIGSEQTFDRLASVTVDAKGERLYIVDIGGVLSDNHRIRVFDARTATHLFDIGKRGREPGEFNLPRDLAIGKDGHLYVVDSGNFRVQVLDANGRFLHMFGTIGKQLGNFARPKEIAVDKEDNIYVVDAAFGNFQIFNADGDLLMFVGERAEKDGPAKYMLPSGIHVDEDGRVYLVDQWFRKVDIFRPAALKPDEGWLAKRVPPKPVAGR